MATFQVKLDTRRAKQDNTYPVVIRIYNGDKYRDIGLGISVFKSQFLDGKGKGKVKACHPNAKNLNLIITKKLNEVRNTTLKLQMKEEVITVESIKNSIVKPTPKFNFMQYGWKTVETLQQFNQHGNADIYRNAINGLIIHSKRQSIEFKELTHDFLLKLENNMLKAGLKANSISVYFRTIKAIFNRAIKEKIVDKELYPFLDFNIKSEATIKRAIERDEIKQIAQLNLPPNTPLWTAREYFMLAFNLIGISFADMATIKPSDITNGRLVYKRKKTHKIYNIKLTEKAQELFSYYMQPNRTYILPIIPESAANDPVKERIYIHYAIKNCNRQLKHIKKTIGLHQELTTYVTRHSWATIAKKLGYSNDLIAESLGHSSGNRTTAIYLDSFDQEVIDAMNEAVCRF